MTAPTTRRGFLAALTAAPLAAAVPAAQGPATPPPAPPPPPARDPDHPGLCGNAAHRDSSANRYLLLLAAALRFAEEVAWSFRRDHPPGCECVWCGADRREHLRWAKDDVDGIEWVAGLSASVLESVVIPDHGTPEPDCWADHAAYLTELSEAAEAAFQAEDADGDGEADRS